MTASTKVAEISNRPRRALIVDDDTTLTAVLGELFQTDGYEVSIADSWLQAIQVIRSEIAEGAPPDLIFLDMHGVDGWEMHAQLERLGIAIPTVVLTGDPDPRRCAEEVNAVGYLSKPFNLQGIDELFDHLVLTGTRISRNVSAA
jgi:CheY-like chemotaxis protein